jgi:hypothetical protein
MKCYTCGHENTKGSKFCSGCGKSFQSKAQTKVNNKDRISLYPYPAAIAAKKAIVQEKSKKFKSIWRVALTSIILANIGLIIISGINGAFLNLWMTVVGLLLTCFISANVKNMKEVQYYSIPTSRDEHGQHHCIHCGNKGIYKSTIYKTQTVVNKCSKCEEILFYN